MGHVDKKRVGSLRGGDGEREGRLGSSGGGSQGHEDAKMGNGWRRFQKGAWSQGEAIAIVAE
jgi:hypothetical protein